MIVILLIIIKYYKQIQNIENYIVYNTNIGDKNIGCTPTTSNHGGSTGNEHDHGCCPIGQGINAYGICENCPTYSFSDDYSINCKDCTGGEVYKANSIDDASGCRCKNNRRNHNGNCIRCNTGYDMIDQTGSYLCKESDEAFNIRKATERELALKSCKIWDTKLEKELTYDNRNYTFNDPNWYPTPYLKEWGHKDFNASDDWTNDMTEDKKFSNGGGMIDDNPAVCRFTFYDDKDFNYRNGSYSSAPTASWDISSDDWVEAVSTADDHSSVKVTIANSWPSDWTQKIETMQNSEACLNCDTSTN